MHNDESTQPPSDENRLLENSTLLAITLASFLGPYMLSAVNVALPAIQSELKMDAVLLAWVATSFLLARLVLLVPIGQIADIFGRRKIFIIGQWVFVIAALMTSLVKTIHALLFFRVVTGLAAAMTATTAVVMLTAVFPPSRRGRAMGIYVAAVYLGASLGPTIGGLLTGHFGWRSVFLSVLPPGLIAIFITSRYVKQEWKELTSEQFDLYGAIVYMLSFIAIGYGATLLPELTALIFAAAGCGGLFIFAKLEKKARFPVFEIGLFHNNRTFSFSSLAALISYAAVFAVTLMMSLYLQYIKGLSPQATGLILISQPAVQAAFSPLAGRLSDRIEPRIIASFGMGLNAACLLAMVFLDSTTPIVHIIVLLVFMGMGFSAFSSPNMNAIMSSVDQKYLSSASGAVATMRSVGQIVSMVIVTLVFSLLLGGMEIGKGNQNLLLGSLRIVFIISTMFCVCGIFFSLMRGELRGNS
jgi:EmrB/QacA subfamily drug resistance transporter